MVKDNLLVACGQMPFRNISKDRNLFCTDAESGQ